MMFDDHEVTDDWYRTPSWRRAVVGGGEGEGNPTTRRVVANGLAAYWAFQGWGNDPSGTSELASPVSAHLHRDTSASSPTGSSKSRAKQYERALIGFKNSDAGWSFIAPTRPVTLLVDCRTMRGEREWTPPNRSIGAIVDTAVWPRLRALLVSAWPVSDRHLILVLGTPLYNLSLLEKGQSFLARFWGGSDKWDEESWAGWSVNQRELLDFCLDTGADSVTILSGDVHYASSALAAVTRGRSESVCVRQFTSSALKNSSGSGPSLAALASASLYERLHYPPTDTGERIAERVAFETAMGDPRLRLSDPPSIFLDGPHLKVQCVIESNIGRLAHHGHRVEHSLLVPVKGGLPGQQSENGLEYRSRLATIW